MIFKDEVAASDKFFFMKWKRDLMGTQAEDVGGEKAKAIILDIAK